MTGGAAAGVAGAIASSALSGAVVGAGSGAVIGGISSVANGGSFAEGASDGFMWGAIGGAVTGGTTGALSSTATSTTSNALNNPLVKNTIENAVDTTVGTMDDLAHGRDVSLGSVALDFGINMAISGSNIDVKSKESPTEYARRVGNEGEKAAGITKKKVRIESATGTASYRIPDELDIDNGILREVKNVKNLSYTNQLKDFNLYAQEQGLQFVLETRKDTKLSKPLQEQIDLKNIT